MRAGLLDRGTNLGLLVGGEIVEDDHITRPERGHEDLLHIGAERDAVDRAVEHRRGGHLGGAQRRDHRVGLPMATGRVIRNARAAEATSVPA